MSRRTLAAAVALSYPRSNASIVGSLAGFTVFNPAYHVGGVTTPTTTTRTQHLRPSHSRRPHSSSTSMTASSSFSSSSSSSSPSSSDFVAPPPPTSKGQPVFPDIELTRKTPLLPEALQRNSDPDAVFVVTGSNRGIGLQFVKSLLERTEGTIVACCRSPTENADALIEVKGSLPSDRRDRVHIQQLDVEDQASIERAASDLRSSYGRVDVLLNVAGILGDGGTTTPGPERSLTRIDREWMEKNLAVNVVGPVMLTQALAPMMQTNTRRRRGRKSKNSEGDSSGEEGSRATAVVASLSARVGSISDNELGGWYSYRLSKAALNQATRTMAHELKRQGTWAVTLHPGTTDTDLSKPFQRNVQQGRLFPVEFTVAQLLDCIDNLEERHSGGLYDWSGKALPFQ